MFTEGQEVLSSREPLGVVRPQTGGDELGHTEGSMEARASVFGGKGRPSPEESERRRVEFVRLIAAGEDFDVAAERARIAPKRALKLLSHPDVRPLLSQAA